MYCKFLLGYVLQPDQEEAQQELAEVRALVLKRKNDSAVDRKRLRVWLTDIS